MMRLTRTMLRPPIRGLDKPPVSGTPLIARTRTWKGTMQVRFEEKNEHRSRSFLVWGILGAPFRVLFVMMVTFGGCYLFLGHDEFMFQLLGYESEMQYEGIVNPIPEEVALLNAEGLKGATSPLRALEKTLHPAPVFAQHLKNEVA
eukprot:GILI01028072.1.p1 GENE.GILI01028072.1~~GILI01028072.1.p1  ORF type:complete len:146 (-),score=10.35 GILI01028072.1:16-453(-)